MSTLEVFEAISGLKVNTEKRVKFCEDLKLEWAQEFTSLGILYNADDLKRITKINIEIKINEIQKLIQVNLDMTDHCTTDLCI